MVIIVEFTALIQKLTGMHGPPEMVGLSLAARWASLRLPLGATPHPNTMRDSPHPTFKHPVVYIFLHQCL